MMTTKLLSKVVLITGSSSGIGEATAVAFSKLGCRLVIHGTNEARLNEVYSKCIDASPENHKPIRVLADFSETKKTAAELISKTLEAYNKLDILVNNAGLYRPIGVESPSAFDQFSEIMKINLDSAVQLSLLAIPHLKRTKGNIVNVSSNLSSQCISGGFAYCSAKAALTMFSKSLAVELAPTVRVNVVSPGPVATLMSTRCGMDTEAFKSHVGSSCLVERVGESSEIARMIVFLASPESAFITGSDYIIDGGSSIKPAGKVMGQE